MIINYVLNYCFYFNFFILDSKIKTTLPLITANSRNKIFTLSDKDTFPKNNSHYGSDFEEVVEKG